jgi:hypothetical protein
LSATPAAHEQALPRQPSHLPRATDISDDMMGIAEFIIGRAFAPNNKALAATADQDAGPATPARIIRWDCMSSEQV